MKKANRYAPERGDIVWLNFTPQSGREQAGKRPALVISPKSYNQKVGLAVCCPITSNAKGYPFEVALPAGLPVEGVVLSDHLKSLDWRTRRASFQARVSRTVLNEVMNRVSALLLDV